MFKQIVKNKKIPNGITKKMYHNNVKKNIFNFKDANLKFARLGKRKASSMSITLDRIANNIPKSSIIFAGGKLKKHSLF